MARVSAKAQREAEAPRGLASAYPQWCKSNGYEIPTTGTVAFIFFSELETKGSPLLIGIGTFNKWKAIKPHFERAGLIEPFT